MKTTHSRRAPLAACCAAAAALTLAATGATAAQAGAVAAASGHGGAPVVTTDDGAVRGVSVPGGYAFRGLPYAAPPTGHLRWRPPAPPAGWRGVRDATQFRPSCPQPPSPFVPPGPFSEDCLYLNVNTSALPVGDQDHRLRRSGNEDGDGGRPVLVWIHGGGLTQDAARNYDPAKLAAGGVVRQSPKRAEAQLRPISAPTLVIWGQLDRYLGQELAEPDHDDVPNLDRVERLPDASHWVHHDEHERVNQLLTDFFTPALPAEKR